MGLALLMALPLTAQATDVIGSGQVVQQPRGLGLFTNVDVSGIGTLTVTQGEVPSLTVQAESNVLPFIQTETSKGYLRIWVDPEHTVHAIEPIQYQLVVSDLDSIQMHGQTDLEFMTPFNTDQFALRLTDASYGNLEVNLENLTIEISDNAKLAVSGTAQREMIQASGSAKVLGKGLKAKAASIKSQDKAKTEVAAEELLEMVTADDSVVDYQGNPTLL